MLDSPPTDPLIPSGNPGGGPNLQDRHRDGSSCCYLLAKELFGLTHFSIPLLQLVGAEEVHEPLAQLFAIRGDLLDHIILLGMGIRLEVLGDLDTSFSQKFMQSCFLIVSEF